MTSPSAAELQEVADRVAARFDYGQPISDTMLVMVANEATAELGIPCEARVEERNSVSTLVIDVQVDPEPGIVPFTVTASPPTRRPTAATTCKV